MNNHSITTLHTPCKITIYTKNITQIFKHKYNNFNYNNALIYTTNDTNIIKLTDKLLIHDKINNILENTKYLYTQEYLINNKFFFKKMLEEMIFTNIHDNKNNISVIFNAHNFNNLLVTYNTINISDDKKSQSKYITLTKYITERIHKLLLFKNNNFDLTNCYPIYFIDRYIGKSSDVIYNSSNLIISINTKYKYVTQENIEKLKKNENIDINNYIFNVIIKPDNYDEFIILYNNKQYEKIRELLWKSDYKSAFTLTRKNLEKIQNVYNEIKNYFILNYGVLEENIVIDIPLFQYIFINFTIIVKIIDIYNIGYEHNRLTYTHGTISLNELINLLSSLPENGELYKILDNKYQIFIDINLYNRLYNNKNNKNNKNNYIEFDAHVLFDDIKNMNCSYTYDKNNIIIDGKLANFKIERIISQKNTRIASQCSISACCNINNKYYIINIAPRTPSYIKYLDKTRIDKSELIDFLTKYTTIDEIILYDHKMNIYGKKRLWYQVELLKIDPNDCTGCNPVKSIKPHILDDYISETLIMMKRMAFINLDENGILAHKLLDCIKEHFTIKLSIIIYNIIRSIIIVFRNCPNYRKTCKEILKQIVNIEFDYNKHQKNKGIDNYYFDDILVNCDNDNFYYNIETIKNNIYVEEKLDYITVPSINNKFDNTNEKKYKLLVWYLYKPFFHYIAQTSIIDPIRSLNVIQNIITNINNIIKNNDIIQKYNSIRKIDITKSLLYVLFKNIYDENYVTDMVNNMLYNVTSLVENVKEKKNIDLFIDNCTKYYKINEFFYAYFHFITIYELWTLHIHLTNKYSKIISVTGSIANLVSTGYRSNFSHSESKYINHNYKHFDIKLWTYKHQIPIIILCIDNYINYLKNNQHINNYIITSYELLEQPNVDSKLLNNINIKLMNFIFSCMDLGLFLNFPQKLKFENIFRNYFLELLEYNNNTLKMLKILYHISKPLKYTS
jgi:hypothetical protein